MALVLYGKCSASRLRLDGCIYRTTLEPFDNLYIHVDLPDRLEGISTIPVDIYITNLRPDIFIASKDKVVLIELSVPFEINVQETHKRKLERYDKLINDIALKDFKVSYYAVEIGSKGYIDKENSSRLKSIFRKFGNDKN